MRLYKAKVAVSSMGSSVIHGGASTFIAVMILSAAKSYIFIVFFKMWFGIVVFGMANGFVLLPVILSFVGPVPDTDHKVEVRRQSVAVRRQSTRSKMQLAAMLAQAGITEEQE